MHASRICFAVLTAVAGLSSVNADASTSISLIPVANHPDGSLDPDVVIEGNEIILPSGGRRVFLEARIGDWDPDDTGVAIKAYQIVPDLESLTSGSRGTLAPALVPCTADAICKDALGAGSTCHYPAGCDSVAPDECSCTPVWIDPERSDAVFFDQIAVCAADTVSLRVACSLIIGAADDPEPFPAGGMNAGTWVLDLPPDARGTFTIGFITEQTLIVDENNVFIPDLVLVAAKITVLGGRCCFDAFSGGHCDDTLGVDACGALVGQSFFTPGAFCEDGGPACADCNGNGSPDVRDIETAMSSDCNWNDVPDDCEPAQCLTLERPSLNVAVGLTNRYLAVHPGNERCNTALRVTFTDMPESFEHLVGEVMWAGKPTEYCENAGQTTPPPGGCGPAPGLPSRTFWAAALQCEPHFTAFGRLGTVYLFHQTVIPGARYVVDSIHENCDPADELAFSLPREFPTAVWGDVSGEYDFIAGGWAAVDGRVDLTVDTLAWIDKFTNHAGAPSKARIDLAPALPDRRVDNIPDLLEILDAFRGFSYPFDAPDPCP